MRFPRRTSRPTDELHQIYALECFLARLVESPYADRLVLKGGVLLAALDVRRPTRDVDFQGQHLSNDVDQVLAMVKLIASVRVDDGLELDADAATAEIIRDQDEYSGVRVTLSGRLAAAQLTFHVDINVASSNLDETQTAQLIERVWASVTTPLNQSSIGADIGVHHDVVGRHLDSVRDAYLLWSVQQLDHEWIGLPRAMDKVYPVDPLIGRLAHLRSGSRSDLDLTVLAESQIGMAMQRAYLAAGADWAGEKRLFYLRTPTRKEVDFVGEALAAPLSKASTPSAVVGCAKPPRSTPQSW